MKKTSTIHLTIVKSLLSLLILSMIAVTGYSQNAGISATGAVPPDASAGLDVNFTNKGLLIPRVTLTSTASFAPLAAHLAGMMVYNTATTGDVTPGIYFNNGAKWIAGLPKTNAAGDMQYWDGSAWKTIPAGQPGQRLQVNSGGIPVWAP